MIKDRLEARTSAKIWIIYTFVVTVCVIIVRIAEPDLLCQVKATCDCGEKFKHLFGVYAITAILSVILRINFYYTSVGKNVTRRELKQR